LIEVDLRNQQRLQPLPILHLIAGANKEFARLSGKS
jgi:hypothetical protein